MCIKAHQENLHLSIFYPIDFDATAEFGTLIVFMVPRFGVRADFAPLGKVLRAVWGRFFTPCVWSLSSLLATVIIVVVVVVCGCCCPCIGGRWVLANSGGSQNPKVRDVKDMGMEELWALISEMNQGAGLEGLNFWSSPKIFKEPIFEF